MEGCFNPNFFLDELSIWLTGRFRFSCFNIRLMIIRFFQHIFDLSTAIEFFLLLITKQNYITKDSMIVVSFLDERMKIHTTLSSSSSSFGTFT